MVLMGQRFPIFSVLLSFQLEHTATAVVTVRGMTRSSLVIDRLTVEVRGCACFRFNLIHGMHVTPSFTTTLVGVSGIFRPFPFATFGGRGATSTQVFLEEFLHMGVILPIKGQLDQRVHKVVVRVCPTLPLRGAGGHRPVPVLSAIFWRRRCLRAHIDDLSCLRCIVDRLSHCDFMLYCSIVLCFVLQGFCQMSL